jgi:hypothetical protein
MTNHLLIFSLRTRNGPPPKSKKTLHKKADMSTLARDPRVFTQRIYSAGSMEGVGPSECALNSWGAWTVLGYELGIMLKFVPRLKKGVSRRSLPKTCYPTTGFNSQLSQVLFRGKLFQLYSKLCRLFCVIVIPCHCVIPRRNFARNSSGALNSTCMEEYLKLI